MNEHKITPRNDTGKVYIKNNRLVWDLASDDNLEIPVPNIRVMGEYTTMHAVYRNDWFIVFVLNAEESFQISAYAQGMQEALMELSSLWGANTNPQLGLATNFKSNVIWPEEISGQELYELKLVESRTWFDRFRARLGFGNPVELVFSDVVKKLLQ